jgi:hypothetical protein
MTQTNDMLAWYNDSLKRFGVGDFRSLTWASADGMSAKNRYNIMNSVSSFNDKNIIEFGCGWGSFFDFGFECKSYYGIDLNENFIKIAKEKYPDRNFEVCDVLSYEGTEKYDLAISSGVAGNRGGPADHPIKLKRYLQLMFNSANVVVVNFPSTWATIRSERIEYFSPSVVLDFALLITENVQLIHKAKSDFFIVMSK